MGKQQQTGNKQLILADDHLVIDTPYNFEQVADTKRIPGARWDKVARVWRVPMTSLDAARRFADKWELWVDPAVHTFTLPDEASRFVEGGQVQLVGDELEIRFPYDQLKAESARRLPLVRWEPSTKSFYAPISVIQEVADWAQRFRIDLHPDVVAAALERRAAAESRIEASRAEDADITVAGLAGGTLRSFQRAGVAYALHARRCFIADDMGLGKTLMSLATLEALEEREGGAYPAVVVCPATLTHNWRVEANKWFPHRSVRLVEGRKEFPSDSADITVVGWANISHWVEELKGQSSYIFDESHYAKTPTAARTKAAMKMARRAPGVVLCLTGTPVTNRPAEYAAQLEILGRLEEFGGRWAFYKRYCNAFRDRFGQWHLEGASHLDELNDRLRSTCYIRRTKDQVMSELPPVQHNPLVVVGSSKAMREYRKAEKDIVEYMVARAAAIAEELGTSRRKAEVVARFRVEANAHIVRLGQLRKIAAMAKLDALDEWVTAHVEAEQKVVLAAHHRDIVDALAAKYGGLKIQGGQAISDIEAAKARFQNESASSAPVIVLSIQAAKTGHTLTAAQNICFVELPWTPADLDQTTSRLHRIGQRGSVEATYLLAEDTIDEWIYELIDLKRSIVEMAIEGSSSDGLSGGSVADLVERFAQLAIA